MVDSLGQCASVGIIGAGVSGLATAKVLQSDGFEVSVFEKAPELGGVWASSRTYPELRTNNTRDLYEFSDLPYPEHADAFPSAEQVREYLHLYADRFDIRRRVHLGKEVVSVSRIGSADTNDHDGFLVRTREVSGSRREERLHFDHVVVCNGVFSEPSVPEVEGSEGFNGTLMHSSELQDTRQLAGMRVVVVGAGKSALDCAAVAAEQGSSCTLIFRAPRWMAPRYVMGVRYDWLFMNRLFEAFYGYHHQGRFERLLHDRFGRLVEWFWRLQSRIALRAADVPAQLVPDEPLRYGFKNLGVGADFYRAVHDGRAVPKRAELAAFEGSSTLRLDTGETLEADVVLFATGWKQKLDFLDEDLRKLVRPDGKFWLYRHILPPKEQRLGFVGYASSLMNTLTSEISAHWLARHFRRDLDLPGSEEMKQEIARVHRWAEKTFPAAREGYFIGPFIAHHVDDLMRDMGLTRRRASNVLTEYLGRFLPRRYRGLGRR